MKNKYLKGAHICEGKMNELLTLFCADKTATEIAALTGISRITVNAYLKLLRKHIAAFCEEKSPLKFSDPSFAIANEKEKAHSANASQKQWLFAITVANDFVYTAELPYNNLHNGNEQLYNRPATEGNLSRYLELYNCHRIADLNTFTLFPAHEQLAPTTQKGQTDRFWNLLRSRIVKFRGLNQSTLYLHVKETEFRYNYRNEDIFGLLLGLIQKKPLHLSRASHQFTQQ